MQVRKPAQRSRWAGSHSLRVFHQVVGGVTYFAQPTFSIGKTANELAP